MSFPVFGSLYQKLLFLLPFTSDYFNYDDPNEWYVDFPQCLGFKQSPISIYSHKAITVSLPPIYFGYYDEFFIKSVEMHNKGHTVEFSVPETVAGEKPFITGGLLSDVYEAEAVHFHWGSAQQKGSEHIINERRYDLEMHIVHKNTNYASIEEAREYEDGIAVMAVLFKSVRSPNVYYPGLNEIYNTLEDVVTFNTTSETQNLITMDSLLADLNKDDFFTYQGSLTTPPCSEAVTWVIFPDILPISHTVLPKFWQLLDERGKVVRNNFRPIQSLEFRDVFHRKPTTNYEF